MFLVSAIIPHAGGRQLLQKCLQALSNTRNVELEAVVVENGSSEITQSDRITAPLETQFLHYPDRIGFAAACNRGVEAANGKYVFLVNNDAFVEPDTIAILVAELNSEPQVAACQPKILSALDKSKFDYSSACGGDMDVYGFPFARGRVFDEVETDKGQYDDRRECFWGAGTALLINRELYLGAGGLEESFFAHMEEIDLLWRFHLMGYTISVAPSAVVYHQGAATIKSGSFSKLYLNHRNNLAMLLRNYSLKSLVRYLPIRIVFDFILLTVSILQLNLKRLWALMGAHCWIILHLPALFRKRRRVQRLRVVGDDLIIRKLFPKSIVLQHFLHHRNTWIELWDAVNETDIL